MIDEARLDELRWSWDNETTADDDWRDTLTADEAALVAAWDDAYEQGLAQMVLDSRKVDCIRETGLSKLTVYRWWDGKNLTLSD